MRGRCLAVRAACGRCTSRVRPRDWGLLTDDLSALRRWNLMRSRWESSGKRIRKLLVYGVRPDPLPPHRGPIEPPPDSACERRIGISCSGGGVRSAAFNLGVLQHLQRAKILERADYLAAVSGGAYIASAFATVQKDLPPDVEPAFAPGTPEEQYLRHRANYMAPTGMSMLYIAYRVLLALVVNVIFVLLPIVFVTILITHGLYHAAEDGGGELAIPGLWRVAAVLAILSALAAVAGMATRRGGIGLQRISETWSTRLLLCALGTGWLFAGLPWLMNVLPDLVREIGELPVIPDAAEDAGKPAAGGAATAAGLSGLLAGIVAALRTAVHDKPLEKGEKADGVVGRLGAGARKVIVNAAAVLAAPLLVAGTMVLVVSQTVERDLLVVGIAAGGCAALFALAYRLADITAWSLHPFYKRRLCSAFALERVTQLSGTEVTTTPWPTLLVCAAANVSDPGATPPGRPVTSFTFSAHAVGGPLTGGVPTTAYENAFGADSPRRRDVTLPAAIAMSGAALAPSMGKLPTRAFTFLLALANARLGVWVPNPGWVAAEPEKLKRYGKARPSYLFRELLGRNRSDGRYLFVTDGGHYENLGLVELRRRGCTDVYCFDASGGRPLGALGDAIALARSELGVEIEIDAEPGQDAILGTIRYPASGDDHPGRVGRLVYATNVVTKAAPWDVKATARRIPSSRATRPSTSSTRTSASRATARSACALPAVRSS